MAKPRQHAAHCGLAQEQTLGRACHILLLKKHVQRHEQIQIKLSEIHELRCPNVQSQIGAYLELSDKSEGIEELPVARIP